MSGIVAKLGWREGMAGWVFGKPDGIELPGFEGQACEAPDVILAFVPDQAALADAAGRALGHYRRGARLWFAYPKRSGRLRTDIDRDHGWELLEAQGLLPVSQIALDGDWSALRFRYRDEIAKLTRKSERAA